MKKRLTYKVTEKQLEDIEEVLKGKSKREFLTDLIVDFLAENISKNLEDLKVEVDKNVSKTISFEMDSSIHLLFKQLAKKLRLNIKDLAYYISTNYLIEKYYKFIVEEDIVYDQDKDPYKEEKLFYINLAESIINNKEDKKLKFIVPYLQYCNEINIMEFGITLDIDSLLFEADIVDDPNIEIFDIINQSYSSYSIQIVKSLYDILSKQIYNMNQRLENIITIVYLLYFIKHTLLEDKNEK